MNGSESRAAENRGKNTNVMSERTLQTVCSGFIGGVKMESTAMVACPALEIHRTPRLWCIAARKAIGHLSKTCAQEAAEAKRMLSAIKAAEESVEGPSWSTALDGTTWRGEGCPSGDFTDNMPKLITPQGQNRAAMCIMVLGPELGLSSARAGEFGESALFESDSESKTEQLKTALSCPKALFCVNVYNHLGYSDCMAKGDNLHTGETESRKPAHYALFRRLGYVVQQVMNPSTTVYDAFAIEVMGPGWRDKLYPGGGDTPSPSTQEETRGVNKMFQRLSSYVNRTLVDAPALRCKTNKGKQWETLVYAIALHPNRPIVKAIVERLYQEDQSYDEDQSVSNEDGDKKKARRFTRSSDPKPEAIQALFSLLPRTQGLPRVLETIAEKGLVNATKTLAVEESTTDILRAFCQSVARGSFIIPSGQGTVGCSTPARSVEDLLPSFVDEGHVDMFAANNGSLSSKLQNTLETCWNAFKPHVKSPEGLLGINKKPVLGFLSASNKTVTVPGKGDKCEVHISTSSVPIEFDSALTGHFLSYEEEVQEGVRGKKDAPEGTPGTKKSPEELEKARERCLLKKKARRLAIEFSMLIVQQVLEVDVAKFSLLWGALDGKGILKTTLQNTPSALDTGNGGQISSFFYQDRLDIIHGATAGKVPMAGAEEEQLDDGAEMQEEMGEGLGTGNDTSVDNVLIDLGNGVTFTGRVSMNDVTSLARPTAVTISLLAAADETDGDNATDSPTANSRGSDGFPTTPTYAGPAQETGDRSSGSSRKRSLSTSGAPSSGIRREEQVHTARRADVPRLPVRPRLSAESSTGGTANYAADANFTRPSALGAARAGLGVQESTSAAKLPGNATDIGSTPETIKQIAEIKDVLQQRRDEWDARSSVPREAGETRSLFCGVRYLLWDTGFG
ncbi:expressed unknown protein [Ectocarpus siliculosus]|uniref:Uncharacterized protein n=1 Tax=Ectocarpus siliculosus TaxID=2880 RepID=D7FRB5_ECTSI|nr:expressed unknown protein [Ectocarpus siliculosus]|eukprot:CBJ30706.1 expressed unknown protein [Ectocarpus siliculosus]